MPEKGFDRVAGIYRTLEYLAFGRTLEAVRFRYLDRIRNARHVLVVGEGDGRFLERLLAIAPDALVRCVDSSPAMLERASGRLDPVARARVTFECADVRSLEVTPNAYDAVVTMFVLDCLVPDEVTRVVRRLAAGLQDDGLWLFSDFVMPERGWRRLHAEAWTRMLYAFFRWQAGLQARALPPSEAILGRAGFRVLESTTYRHGLLRAAVYARHDATEP